MDRRRQEVEDWRAEQARLKGLTEHLRAEKEAEKAAEREAAEKKAGEAAADKADADKAPAETAGAVKGETLEDAPAAAAKAPIASAPSAPRSDEVGTNAPFSAAPMPPVRPKARPAPPDPTQGGVY